MRIVTLLSIALVLSGCAAGDWYKAPNGAEIARLRVVASAPSNTMIEAISKPTCDSQDSQLLGWFHPMAGSMQANRRGYDRRVGIPLGHLYPNNMFAEHTIEASKSISVFASGIFTQSPIMFDVGLCKVVGTFTPLPGHDYEILYVGEGSKCDLKLFEVVSQKSVSPRRIEAKFDNGVVYCGK